MFSFRTQSPEQFHAIFQFLVTFYFLILTELSQIRCITTLVLYSPVTLILAKLYFSLVCLSYHKNLSIAVVFVHLHYVNCGFGHVFLLLVSSSFLETAAILSYIVDPSYHFFHIPPTHRIVWRTISQEICLIPN